MLPFWLSIVFELLFRGRRFMTLGNTQSLERLHVGHHSHERDTET